MQFLVSAFLVAIGLMALILVTQFNSYYQAALVLSAIVFSTAGVLMGLLITGQAFGIVMVGMGVIALAGIVVNNNIVLIDTYNELRAEHASDAEAGCLRLRPCLTAITTVLGLMPMVLGSTSICCPALVSTRLPVVDTNVQRDCRWVDVRHLPHPAAHPLHAGDWRPLTARRSRLKNSYKPACRVSGATCDEHWCLVVAS